MIILKLLITKKMNVANGGEKDIKQEKPLGKD